VQKWLCGNIKLDLLHEKLPLFENSPTAMNIQVTVSDAHQSLDNGDDISTLKRHGGWHSVAVAESYIEGSIENKKQTAMKILA
jgi:hypothetical protein